MVKRRNRCLAYTIFFCALLAVTLTACGKEQPDAGGDLEVYQQMLLYIREGLYQHGIEETFQAYFGAVEDDGKESYWHDTDRDGHFCEVLLEGNGNFWRESLAYTYDAENGWYTFCGQYEPVLVGEPRWGLYEDSDFVLELKDNHVYTCQISGKTDLPYPMKYIAENAPVESDMRIDIPFSEAWRGASGAEEDRLSYGVYPRLYTYMDDRLDMYVTISYPEISLSGVYDDTRVQKMEYDINEMIKSAFFYSYGTDDGDMFNPRKELYGSIQRNYIITRRDENYLSMRIYESNYFRGANHPNEWETAITMDMHNGKVLSLGDVVGEERTIGDLFASGAFRCMWYWRDGGEELMPEEYNAKYIGSYRESAAKCSQYDSNFYITDKTLGLITIESRYYTNVEATFEDLGLSGF